MRDFRRMPPGEDAKGEDSTGEILRFTGGGGRGGVNLTYMCELGGLLIPPNHTIGNSVIRSVYYKEFISCIFI